MPSLVAVLLPVAIAFLLRFLISGDDVSHCRCSFGDACWPSQTEFDALERQISQPLLWPLPPAEPCYHDGNSSECATIVKAWADADWRADQAGAMQAPNFETFSYPNGTIDACYLNTSLHVPCKQGSVPVVGVDARVIGDVQIAVKFAAKHHLHLVVKNTGHDYFGRSAGRGSFVIWTHHLKNITVHPSFHPDGVSTDESPYELAVTLGAGVQWHEAYAAAKAAGRTIVGGGSAAGSVGAAGGWLLGGGHSPLSPSHGLGVDNVLEISLVTSNGTYITANAHRHPDLFWALRGGGGGTYGVVTSVTYRTYPLVPVVGMFVHATVNSIQPTSSLRQVFTELVRITPALTDASWGGFALVSPDPKSGTTMYALFGVAPNVSWEQANATVNPYLEFVQRVAASSSADAPLVVTAAQTAPFSSYYDWYDVAFGGAGMAGINTGMGSWLLPRSLLESDPERVGITLIDIPNPTYYLFVGGGAVSRVDPEAAGLNPAWREANAHVALGTGWPEGADSATIAALMQQLQESTAKLRALALQSGAYFNEASLQEPDPRHAFFGPHYSALRSIKKAYDPSDLFVVSGGVGSDEWDKGLRCRL